MALASWMAVWLAWIAFPATPGAGLGCYKCQSVNQSDHFCHDPYNPGHRPDYYHRVCMQGLDGRVGAFPAKYCTKVAGTCVQTGVEMVVRSCAHEAFDNVCGPFRFANKDYYGCLMSCTEDACNQSEPSAHPSRWISWTVAFVSSITIGSLAYFDKLLY